MADGDDLPSLDQDAERAGHSRLWSDRHTLQNFAPRKSGVLHNKASNRRHRRLRIRPTRHVATLRAHVAHVVAVRPQEKMIGSNTRRVVAAMQNELLAGVTYENRKGEPVRNDERPVLTAKTPISAGNGGTRPDPARSRLPNVRKKSSLRRHGSYSFIPRALKIALTISTRIHCGTMSSAATGIGFLLVRHFEISSFGCRK